MHPRPVIPMGLTPEHAMVPTLRALDPAMAMELFAGIIDRRDVALMLAGNPRCLAIGVGFQRPGSGTADAAAAAQTRGGSSSDPQTWPEYTRWAEPHLEDEEATPAPAVTVQVLYSRYPYLIPDPAMLGVWPWAAEGEGWRLMSAAFRDWMAAHAPRVFAALGCCELHLWMDLRQPWKIVVPQRPDQPMRVEA